MKKTLVLFLLACLSPVFAERAIELQPRMITLYSMSTNVAKAKCVDINPASPKTDKNLMFGKFEILKEYRGVLLRDKRAEKKIITVLYSVEKMETFTPGEVYFLFLLSTAQKGVYSRVCDGGYDDRLDSEKLMQLSSRIAEMSSDELKRKRIELLQEKNAEVDRLLEEMKRREQDKDIINVMPRGKSTHYNIAPEMMAVRHGIVKEDESNQSKRTKYYYGHITWEFFVFPGREERFELTQYDYDCFGVPARKWCYWDVDKNMIRESYSFNEVRYQIEEDNDIPRERVMLMETQFKENKPAEILVEISEYWDEPDCLGECRICIDNGKIISEKYFRYDEIGKKYDTDRKTFLSLLKLPPDWKGDKTRINYLLTTDNRLDTARLLKTNKY